MSTSIEKPDGRSMAELRAIVAEDRRRFDRLAELWDRLTATEQDEVLAFVETRPGIHTA